MSNGRHRFTHGDLGVTSTHTFYGALHRVYMKDRFVGCVVDLRSRSLARLNLGDHFASVALHEALSRVEPVEAQVGVWVVLFAWDATKARRTSRGVDAGVASLFRAIVPFLDREETAALLAEWHLSEFGDGADDGDPFASLAR